MDTHADASIIKNKIVLVGVTAESVKDELFARTLRPRSSPRSPSQEQRPLFAANQALVELEQCRRAHAHGDLGYSAGRNEQGAEAQHEALERREIRGPLSGPTENQQLLLDEHIFRRQSAHPARPEQPGEDRDKVNQQ